MSTFSKTLAILCLPISLFAQNFTGGFGAGFTTSQIHADLHAGYNKGGLMAYTFVEKEIKDMEFGLGLRYIQKGSRMMLTLEKLHNEITKLSLAMLNCQFTLYFRLNPLLKFKLVRL